MVLLSFGDRLFLARGLVGHWNFDGGRGTLARDSSGKGNHGTVRGAKWTKGKLLGALSFGPGNDCVDCGAGATLNVSGAVTIALWAKLDAAPHQRHMRIVSKKRTWHGPDGYDLRAQHPCLKSVFATGTGPSHPSLRAPNLRTVLQRDIRAPASAAWIRRWPSSRSPGPSSRASEESWAHALDGCPGR